MGVTVAKQRGIDYAIYERATRLIPGKLSRSLDTHLRGPIHLYPESKLPLALRYRRDPRAYLLYRDSSER